MGAVVADAGQRAVHRQQGFGGALEGADVNRRNRRRGAVSPNM